MQHDLGAADTARGAGLVGGFNGEALAARRRPDKGLFAVARRLVTSMRSATMKAA
jgi:hypothetical protein